MNTKKFFADLLPTVRKYGQYGLALQKITAHHDKGGGNPIASVVTDADFIIQEGILRHILEKYSHLAVFAEEESPYLEKFKAKSRIMVALDPIDGTYSYKKGFGCFATIVSVYEDKKLADALVYLPAGDLAYSGVKKLIRNTCNIISVLPPFPERLRKRLRKNGFAVYDVQERPDITKHSLFKGRVAAVVIADASPLDDLPFSRVVEKAGGFASDFKGRPLKRMWGQREDMVVSASKEVHRKILRALA